MDSLVSGAIVASSFGLIFNALTINEGGIYKLSFSVAAFHVFVKYTVNSTSLAFLVLLSIQLFRCMKREVLVSPVPSILQAICCSAVIVTWASSSIIPLFNQFGSSNFLTELSLVQGLHADLNKVLLSNYFGMDRHGISARRELVFHIDLGFEDNLDVTTPFQPSSRSQGVSFIAPFQPRLDLEIFRSSSIPANHNFLVRHVAARILQMKKPVLRLFEDQTRPSSRLPEKVFISVRELHFSKVEEWSSHYWISNSTSIYLSPLSLSDQSISSILNDMDSGNLSLKNSLSIIAYQILSDVLAVLVVPFPWIWTCILSFGIFWIEEEQPPLNPVEVSVAKQLPREPNEQILKKKRISKRKG